MKKTNHTRKDMPRVLQERSFRRWVKQMLSSWAKRLNFNCSVKTEIILAKLQGIEDSIEIIARELARKAKM